MPHKIAQQHWKTPSGNTLQNDSYWNYLTTTAYSSKLTYNKQAMVNALNSIS